MEAIYFDLETSDLKGDVGRILCASFMNPSGETWTLRADDYSDNLAKDGKLAEAIRDTLEEYPIICGWYAKGFDVPFLRTRLAAAGKRILAPRFVVDPCFTMRGWRGLSPRSSSLKVAAEFFKIPERKMDVDVEVWIDAALGGDKKAMTHLCRRCESDVEILYEVTQKLLGTGLIKQIQTY